MGGNSVVVRKATSRKRRPKLVTLSTPLLLDAPSESDQLTEYDREHFATYLFLLDCAAGDMDWRDAMTQLIGMTQKLIPVKRRRCTTAMSQEPSG
jgi:hypothetical protein